MRLLVATPLYPPEPGGPATYAKLLEEHLPARGIRVKVVPFSLVRHLLPGVRHVAYAWELFRYAYRADVIFAQDTFSVGAPAALVALLLRKPFVVRVPGDYAWEQSRQRFGVMDGVDAFQEKRYGPRVEALRTVQRFVVGRADRVIAPSEYFARLVSGWGIPKDRVRAIYNGIDLSVEEEPPRNPPSGKILLSIGRLTPWKGFDLLIRLLSELPRWTLVIAGDGPQRQELKRLALSEGVADRVLFTGAISRAQMFGWCRVADAFALNTSFESFSFQTVEAMHAGVPVIATRVGSIPELIEDGKEGALCAPDDAAAFLAAIRSIETEPELWRARTEAAQEKAARFTITATLDRLEAELRTLL
jgi:glycosyltransferase involved in cell wall biosynthesis